MLEKDKKARLLEDGVFKDFRQTQYVLYNDLKECETDFKAIIERKDEALKEIYGDDYDALKQLLAARKKQVQKVKQHIKYLIYGEYDIYFLTFTYSDAKRKSKKALSPSSMREYVKKALKQFDDYILNVDYGSENSRLHFHAIAAIRDPFVNGDEYMNIDKDGHYTSKFKAMKEYMDKVGFIYIEKVKLLGTGEDNDTLAIRLARYLDKLTLHSLKVKQSYVAVKKGTDYQKWKSDFKSYMKAIDDGDTWKAHHLKELDNLYNG